MTRHVGITTHPLKFYQGRKILLDVCIKNAVRLLRFEAEGKVRINLLLYKY